MRFSEALAITPKDFDFVHQTLSINKTWDYKGNTGFLPTKNKSSVRKIQIDWQTVIQFSELVKGLPDNQPIFVRKGNVYNSTVNDILERKCEAANISVISVHGLRHTHASLLLFAGVSIASVARRLGHASMTTTQKTYLHIIQELENQDVDLVMRSLSGLSYFVNNVGLRLTSSEGIACNPSIFRRSFTSFRSSASNGDLPPSFSRLVLLIWFIISTISSCV